MADSRLTDLPNFTEIDDDDTLYIVDVSQDTSNKITYSSLVGNKIEALSASITNLNIPDIALLSTRIATVSSTTLLKSDQSSLNSTNSRVDILEADNTTNKTNIGSNLTRINDLSGFVDGKAPLSAVSNNGDDDSLFTKVNGLSTQIDLKATVDSVILKTDKTLHDSLSSVVGNLENQVNITEASTLTTFEFDIANLNLLADDLSSNSIELSTSLFGLTGEGGTFALQADFEGVSANVDDIEEATDDISQALGLSATHVVRPFNTVTIDTNSSLITTFEGLAPNFDGSLPGLSSIKIKSDLGTTVSTYISSENLNSYVPLSGLIFNATIIGENKIELNAHNFTSAAIKYQNDEVLIFYIDNIFKTTQFVDLSADDEGE